jgi:hypothetical protein
MNKSYSINNKVFSNENRIENDNFLPGKMVLLKNFYLVLIVLSLFTSELSAQDLKYYFGSNISFNQTIPSPEKFLGYPIGSRVTEHYRVNAYLDKLAELSDRAETVVIGKTHEGRDIKILIVSAPENIKNLDKIRQDRQKVRQGEKQPDSTPVIGFLGYSVHGNEASGTEASLLSAYYLVAGETELVKKELTQGIYFVDVSRNPDGHERFTSWVNANAGVNVLNDSPLDREHNETWPGGRGNHYWFDLNRDWVNIVHPESRARVAFFQSWLPHVQVDHHEMGTNSSFFFEPTDPNGNESAYVPALNYELNKTIGNYIARDYEKIGSYYYTKEDYDNKNPTFGSTYPDYNGAVGILFEQGSSRGIVQQSDNGPVTFAHTIRNQLVASLATVQAAVENKEQFFKLQEQFFTAYKTDKDVKKSYIVGDSYDITRLNKFIDLLLYHKLDVYQNNTDVTINGVKYEKGKSYIIPVGQPNNALVKIIFDQTKDYKDPSKLSYGSGFSIVLSSGLAYAETLQTTRGEKVTSLVESPVSEPVKSDYAYLIDYRDSRVAKTALKLLSNGLLIKTAFKPFKIKTATGVKDFSYGTVLIPVQNQKISSDELFTLLKKISKDENVEITPVITGLSVAGPDLGSSNFQKIEVPKVLVFSGQGTSGTEVGEVWYLFDQKLQYPLVRADLNSRRGFSNLNEFNRIVLTSGDYGKPFAEQVKNWVQAGGTLITINAASKWAIDNGVVTEKIITERPDSSSVSKRIPYAQAEEREAYKRIPTTIFATDIDITQPLGFGFTSSLLPVVRESTVFYKPSKSPYATVTAYTEDPLLNGYISADNLKKLKSSASVLASNAGAGRVVLFAEDPLFRGIWDATTKVFVNAILLGDNISVPGGRFR